MDLADSGSRVRKPGLHAANSDGANNGTPDCPGEPTRWQVDWSSSTAPPLSPESEAASFLPSDSDFQLDSLELVKCQAGSYRDSGNVDALRRLRSKFDGMLIKLGGRAPIPLSPPPPDGDTPVPTRGADDSGVELYEEDVTDGPKQPDHEPEIPQETGPASAGLLPTDHDAEPASVQPPPAKEFTPVPQEMLQDWLRTDMDTIPVEPQNGHVDAPSALACDPAVALESKISAMDAGPFQVGRLFIASRPLRHGLTGALLAGSVFFLLWLAGLEPPPAWRCALSPAATPPLSSPSVATPVETKKSEASPDRTTEPEQLRQAQETIDRQARLLAAAHRDATEATRMASEAINRTKLLEDNLQKITQQLAAFQSQPKETSGLQTSARDVQRTAFTPPESLPVADPAQAHRCYTKGLTLYQEHRYSAAEKEFLKAVHFDLEDARYHYCLGLARLSLGEQAAAAESFRQGAKLESEHKPSPVFVSVALETIGREARRVVNDYRPEN
jgi:TolA-binding protein